MALLFELFCKVKLTIHCLVHAQLADCGLLIAVSPNTDFFVSFQSGQIVRIFVTCKANTNNLCQFKFVPFSCVATRYSNQHLY